MLHSLFDNVLLLITRLISFQHFKEITFNSSPRKLAAIFSQFESFTYLSAFKDALIEGLSEFDCGSIEYIAVSFHTYYMLYSAP